MRKRKILVVDDELDTRTFLSTVFEASGYKPIVAADGVEGLRKAKEARPDVIILDVMMPKEGGLQLYRTLKTDPDLKQIPIIMLSGIAKKTFFHSQATLDAYMGQSVPEPEAYIEKPPDPDEILNLVAALLQRPA